MKAAREKCITFRGMEDPQLPVRNNGGHNRVPRSQNGFKLATIESLNFIRSMMGSFEQGDDMTYFRFEIKRNYMKCLA